MDTCIARIFQNTEDEGNGLLYVHGEDAMIREPT